MDDEDNDDNTCERGQTITILKPRLSLRIIGDNKCKGDILQLEKDISRQKMITQNDQCLASVLLIRDVYGKANLNSMK